MVNAIAPDIDALLAKLSPLPAGLRIELLGALATVSSVAKMNEVQQDLNGKIQRVAEDMLAVRQSLSPGGEVTKAVKAIQSKVDLIDQKLSVPAHTPARLSACQTDLIVWLNQVFHCVADLDFADAKETPPVRLRNNLKRQQPGEANDHAAWAQTKLKDAGIDTAELDALLRDPIPPNTALASWSKSSSDAQKQQSLRDQFNTLCERHAATVQAVMAAVTTSTRLEGSSHKPRKFA